MPNRTIYIADADVPLFEKAQKLAGDNLSAAIASALRTFVEGEEARQGGYEDITVKVG
ncbi:MAG: EXLDI protein, partial [Planctomycetes bacterium]|nr:EXLDI protein [Planctomycetota bacterium]